MNKTKRFLITTVLTVLVLSFMGTASGAVSNEKLSGSKPVADEIIGSNGISWLPKVSFAQLLLTVARPDGTLFSKTFTAGSTPYIDLSDLYGDNSSNGTYTYELRVHPVSDNKVIIGDGYGVTDKQPMSQKSLIQIGYIRVQGGMIVPNRPQEGLNRTSDTFYSDCEIQDSYIPVLRLTQTPTNAYSWDIAADHTLFTIWDVTGGPSIPFAIEATCPTATLYLTSSGKVGIGTNTPGYVMELKKTGVNAEFASNRTDGATCYISGGLYRGFFGTKTNHPLRFVANDTWRMELATDDSLTMKSGATCTSGGVWTSVSSRDAKENIKNLTTDEAIETLNGLNPVRFNYKAEKEEEYVGFIAEDVPELVSTRDRKHLTSMDIVAVLAKVVQEQQKSISQLKKEIVELKKSR